MFSITYNVSREKEGGARTFFILVKRVVGKGGKKGSKYSADTSLN